MRIIGMILCLAALMVGIGSSLPAMVDFRSFMIVAVGSLGIVLLGGHSLGGMHRVSFESDAVAEDISHAIRGWRMARLSVLGIGGVGAVIGIATMIAHMDDPVIIGPGMALTLLSCLYSLCLAFILFLPLQVSLERRVQAPPDGSVLPSAVLGALGALFFSILSFAILLVPYGAK